MRARIERRARRQRDHERISFLPADATIGRTTITVSDARAGRFDGGDIPPDLQRQWIQGTGPAARPRTATRESIRNVAYALLSGADGWMFDGEDALGQVDSMSLDNQRNLKLAFARADVFMSCRRAGRRRDERLGSRASSIAPSSRTGERSWTSRRGSSVRAASISTIGTCASQPASPSPPPSSTWRCTSNNHAVLRSEGRSVVLYLPKIQTAEEAALWNDMLDALERHLGLPRGEIKVYVLVEQIEACFQLMEIRAALGPHFVGFNTGRWDYINSVSDAASWDPAVVNPNIDAITMTYGYMRVYEDRVRRAVNTPDRQGRFALWQGGMEPNIPVGSPAGVAGEHGAGDCRRRARTAGGRERQMGRPLEDGAHRPAGLGEGRRGESARSRVSRA